jgi:hypothetical protein
MAVILTLERRRLLRMLARSPNGCTEALLMGYGFSMKFLADVVFERRNQLSTAPRWRDGNGGAVRRDTMHRRGR